MHNRQSGAAHVPIMFFLILLVMFLGALGFAYVTQTKNGELIKQRDEARANAAKLQEQSVLVKDYIEDIGNVIGKPGEYKGRPGGVYGGAEVTMPGVMNPQEVQRAMEKACADAGVSTSRGLENVLGALVTYINQAKRRVGDIELERDKAMTDKNEIDRKFQATTADTSTKAREWSTNLDQSRADFASGIQERENRISSTQDNLKAKAEELTTVRDAAAEKEKLLNNELAKERMHVSAILARDAMRNPPDQADGKILVAKQNVAIAFIGLGRKDMLQRGTVFQVKNPNSAAVKGYATVTRVEEERAEVELSGFVDPIGDYARDGDLLYNKIYSPGLTRTIYLMGSFSAPYFKPELTKLLTRLGNKVVDKIGPGVDTVILGNNPINEAGDGFATLEASDEYKKATELRVEFAYLTTIRDLIKL